VTDDETDPGARLTQDRAAGGDGDSGRDQFGQDPEVDTRPDDADAEAAEDDAELEGDAEVAEDDAELDDTERDDTERDDTELDDTGGGAHHPPSWRARSVAFGVVRAAVVLIGAAVVYQAVVPVNHVARGRLAHLVVTKSGVAAYDSAKPNSAEQPTSQIGLAALQTAAAKSPNETGAYSIQWVPSQTSGAGLVVLLFPDVRQATTGLDQLVKAQLGPTTYSSDGLKRLSMFTVASVPDATGAVYEASKPVKGQPGLAVVAYRYQRALVLGEAFSTGSNQADAGTLAHTEYTHLQQILPGFSIRYVTHPMVATILWAAGSAALAAIAGFAPAGWRAAGRRRQRRREAELATRVVVAGQVIHKRRL
jgi:hypothetical protein